MSIEEKKFVVFCFTPKKTSGFSIKNKKPGIDSENVNNEINKKNLRFNFKKNSKKMKKKKNT